jgi:hypothetical protein
MPASIFIPANIKSTNKPAAILELSHLLQADEQAISADNRPNNVTITYDGEGTSVTISLTIPVGFTLDANGKPTATAIDYLLSLT